MDTRRTIVESEGGAEGPAPAGGAAAPSPRLVIRGESPGEDGKRLGAFTDYLNVTFVVPTHWSDPAPGFFYRFAECIGPAFGIMEDLGRGFHGYRHSYGFERGSVRYAFGGQAGTALLRIPGDGCALVPNWDRLV